MEGAPMLNIILTSFDRPKFIARTLDSLLAQTDDRWRCTVVDDGSGAETLDVLTHYGSLGEERVNIILEGEPDDREAASRYAVLINQELPRLTDGLVGYLCDNVEYDEELVATVLDWFETRPGVFGGYVTHQRDVWKRDGSTRLGTAAQFGHWDITPPEPGIAIANAMGLLDHSQVFHRLPCAVRWDESRESVARGDGVFFNRLISKHGPLLAIAPGRPLTFEHLVK